LTTQWSDYSAHSDNRTNLIVIPLHSGSCVKTPLADNATIDIDGRMWCFDHLLGQLSEDSFNTYSKDEILAVEGEFDEWDDDGNLVPHLENAPAQDEAGVWLVIGNLNADQYQRFSFVRTLPPPFPSRTYEQTKRHEEEAEHLDALFEKWGRARAEFATIRQGLLATSTMAITRRNAITGFEVLPSTRCVDAAFSS
jgi:hypothetical protein